MSINWEDHWKQEEIGPDHIHLIYTVNLPGGLAMSETEVWIDYEDTNRCWATHAIKAFNTNEIVGFPMVWASVADLERITGWSRLTQDNEYQLYRDSLLDMRDNEDRIAPVQDDW